MNENDDSKKLEDEKRKFTDLKKEIKEMKKKINGFSKELKSFENESYSQQDTDLISEPKKPIEQIIKPIREETVTVKSQSKEKLSISSNVVLKIANHALKYAHSKIPKKKWVEVIGLLAGYLDEENNHIYIEDAYPIGHGSKYHVKMRDDRSIPGVHMFQEGHEKVYREIKKLNLFICGWYHSHPGIGVWMSEEDVHTHWQYQKPWKGAVALVIDPSQIEGESLGFDIFRISLKTREFFSVPFDIIGDIDRSTLPKILAVMKATYVEYDED